MNLPEALFFMYLGHVFGYLLAVGYWLLTGAFKRSPKSIWGTVFVGICPVVNIIGTAIFLNDVAES